LAFDEDTLGAIQSVVRFITAELSIASTKASIIYTDCDDANSTECIRDQYFWLGSSQ
jgi:hypothetical protein